MNPDPTTVAVRHAAAAYALPGPITRIEPLPGGHINDSFVLTCAAADDAERFILQRINDRVFPRPRDVVENIHLVTAHIRAGLERAGVADIDRRVLTLLPTRDGRWCVRRAGGVWRLIRHIDNARAPLAVTDPHQAEQAGLAFGAFQRLLADYDGPRLVETIPDFHHTPTRFDTFDRVVAEDPCRRVARTRDEIAFLRGRRGLASVLLDLQRQGHIPERIVHNDAKISNVLLDREREEWLCVVDLDTVMPGLSLFDFGDMVRSMTSPSDEDETDLSKVGLQPELFAALARGYVAEAGGILTPAERKHLVTAGKLITLEQAVRFLADYLAGDRYYRITRPDQNLDRCRTQIRLIESIESQEAALQDIVAKLF